MKICILINNIDEFGLLTNALVYNAINLYNLYNNSKLHTVSFVNTDNNIKGKFNFCGKKYIHNQLSADVDIILQVCTRLNTATKLKLKAINPQIKFILIEYGNRYIINISNYMHLEKNIEKFPINLYDTREDCVWISPHFEHTIDYYKILYKTENVYICPYIWSTEAISHRVNDINYKPKKTQQELVIGIFESNLMCIKTSIIPIYIAEMFNKKYPGIIKGVYVYNLKNFIKKQSFNEHMYNTSLYIENKLFLYDYPANIVNTIKENNINTVISNQILNSLNYLYLEMFFMNINLIHNSPDIKDYGFYYDNLNISQGCKALEQTLEQTIEQNFSELFHKYSIHNTNNMKKYLELLFYDI